MPSGGAYDRRCSWPSAWSAENRMPRLLKREGRHGWRCGRASAVPPCGQPSPEIVSPSPMAMSGTVAYRSFPAKGLISPSRSGRDGTVGPSATDQRSRFFLQPSCESGEWSRWAWRTKICVTCRRERAAVSASKCTTPSGLGSITATDRAADDIAVGAVEGEEELGLFDRRGAGCGFRQAEPRRP